MFSVLPGTATAPQPFSVCGAHGGQARDHCALLRALELLANFEIAPPPG